MTGGSEEKTDHCFLFFPKLIYMYETQLRLQRFKAYSFCGHDIFCVIRCAQLEENLKTTFSQQSFTSYLISLAIAIEKENNLTLSTNPLPFDIQSFIKRVFWKLW